MEHAFNFDNNLPKEPSQSVGTDNSGKADEPVSPFGSQLNLARLIGSEAINWIKGDLETKPQAIKQLGDDFAQKLNWYVGCTILAQYARIPALFEALNTVSEKLFTGNDFKEMKSIKDLSDYYSMLQKEIGQIMEFARKFVVQNKDFLADNSNFFDRSLFEKIKAMPTDQVRDYLTLFQIIERKGQQTLKDIIEQYKE